VAKVPRTWCRTDGVHQVPVPWAREGSGYTLLMEALVMFLSAEMPVEGMADLLHETDTRLWRVLIYYVQQAQARRDWSGVRRIAVDETSARRGHRYVTNVLDCDGAGLLLMVEGRSSEALGCFAQALREHGADPAQIQAIAMDMSPAYRKGAADHFPQAQIVFDKLHVMLLAGQALETVRRQLQHEGAELKGSLWSLRGNAWNLSAERQKQRQDLCARYTARRSSWKSFSRWQDKRS
jgi:transposase